MEGGVRRIFLATLRTMVILGPPPSLRAYEAGGSPTEINGLCAIVGCQASRLTHSQIRLRKKLRAPATKNQAAQNRKQNANRKVGVLLSGPSVAQAWPIVRPCNFDNNGVRPLGYGPSRHAASGPLQERRLQQHALSVECQEASLSFREAAYVERPAGVEAHAAQRAKACNGWPASAPRSPVPRTGRLVGGSPALEA